MNYLLDTNVISEFRNAKRMNAQVRQWISGIKADHFYLSVVTINEIRYGIKCMENRDASFAELLKSWYETILSDQETYKLLEIDALTAHVAADFRHAYKLPNQDSLIAATAQVKDLTLVTRNIKDFQHTPVKLINPWTA